MVTTDALISGSSASLILLTAYITAIACFVRAKKLKTPFLNWAGLFFICMGSFYLGTVSSFGFVLAGLGNIRTDIAGFLCYTVTPIGSAISMYMAFTVIKPKISKWITILYALTAIPFWYFFYFQTSTQITSNIILGTIDPMEGLIDLELLGITRIFTIVYLGSFLLILVPAYLWLAKVSSGTMRQKAILQTLGYFLFVVCGFIDSGGYFGAIGIAIVRVMMASAYILLFVGFTKS